MKVGILTSGGDCQGLNASLRGVAKTMFNLKPDIELYGIYDGYLGLIQGEWRRMQPYEFSGILTQGGTILGTSRQPFKNMRVREKHRRDKLSMMLDNYRKGGFDALVILGGNGTHKTANLLAQNGCNIVTLPKTIDNDLWGTDLTFGFDSAVEKATSVIDAIHTTAASHGRVFVIELMGHAAGWVALYAGIAGGADVILLPELPYEVDKVVEVIEGRNNSGKHFSIIAIAEGALTKREAELSREERLALPGSAALRLSEQLKDKLDQDVRIAIPGHYQRGGDPTPTDRMLCSRLGALAGELVVKGKFGKTVVFTKNRIKAVPLSSVAGRKKLVPHKSEILHQAKLLGISFAD